MTKPNTFPHNPETSFATLRWCSGSSRYAPSSVFVGLVLVDPPNRPDPADGGPNWVTGQEGHSCHWRQHLKRRSGIQSGIGFWLVKCTRGHGAKAYFNVLSVQIALPATNKTWLYANNLRLAANWPCETLSDARPPRWPRRRAAPAQTPKRGASNAPLSLNAAFTC